MFQKFLLTGQVKQL